MKNKIVTHGTVVNINQIGSGRPRSGKSPAKILQLFKESFAKTREQVVEALVYLMFPGNPTCVSSITYQPASLQNKTSS